MMKIKQDLMDLVGNTPLFELVRLEQKHRLKAKLVVKLEYLNPAGSAKDRIAKAMILDAEKKGILKKGATIIEPTSGNTGIGLASLASARGYHVLLTMPETMSVERRNLLKAYGASIVLTPGHLGMQGAIDEAEKLHQQIKHSLIVGQFTNKANVEAHYQTTGPEIYEDSDGQVDIFVAGVGTGGTITGTGRYLKERKPSVQVVAVEPATSPLLSQGKSGTHGLQGIGANFVPDILDTHIYDDIIPVQDEEAYFWGREIAKEEGIMVGISSGAALFAGVQLAKKDENEGKMIVVLLPDTGDRYLSTPLFQEMGEDA